MSIPNTGGACLSEQDAPNESTIFVTHRLLEGLAEEWQRRADLLSRYSTVASAADVLLDCTRDLQEWLAGIESCRDRLNELPDDMCLTCFLRSILAEELERRAAEQQGGFERVPQ